MSKIIYASLDQKGLTGDQAATHKADALMSISHLVERLHFTDSTGIPIQVEVNIDAINHDKAIFSQASVSSPDTQKYRIDIGAGLLAQIDTVARSLAADKSLLRGRTRSTLLDGSVRPDGREKALSDFVFHYMVMFIFWHEVAHIAMGHLDWLSKYQQGNKLVEFGVRGMTPENCAARRTLEADADKMAATWTASQIDYALQHNPFLRYRSVADAMYDVGLIYGALFLFLDSIDKDIPFEERTHPDAQIRMGIAWSFVQDYLDKFHRDASAILQSEVYGGGIAALKHIVHPLRKSLDIFRIAEFISGNGKAIEKLGVRQFQHRGAVGPSSFTILP